MRMLTLVALAVAPTAGATDLPATVTDVDLILSGSAGEDGDDEGRAVALDSTGAAVVAGWLDGLTDHADDAVLFKVLPGGAAPDWTVTVDGGPVDGLTRVVSDDRFYGVAIDDTDDILVAGGLSGSLAEGWNSAWYVASYDPTGQTRTWFKSYQDSVSSLAQAAHGVAVDPADGDVVGVGWAFRSATVSGRWLMYRLLGTTGLVQAGPIGYDFGTEAFAPDQAWDTVVDGSSNIYVVGAIGIDGGTDATNRNYDWLVRKYDANFVLVWEKTWSGLVGHDDVARSVALDPDGNIVVAGYTNAGSDNDTRADWDWLVVKYDAVTGDPLWEVVWDSAGGGNDEQAFAVDVDDAGDVLVGGSAIDATGASVWRLAHLAGLDGAEISALTWSAVGAIQSIDERDGQIALAGWELNTDRDLVVRVLDEDEDGDGIGNHADGCPDDPAKDEPLICGCGKSEQDSDGDTYADCVDECPDLVEKWEDGGVCGCDEPDDDSDADGAEDCIDNCPGDPNKTELGICGCGIPDSDSDGDGVPGCDDACSNTPAGVPVDENGCPEGEGGKPIPGGGDTGTDGGATGGDKGGCGCSSAPAGGSWALAVVGLALIRRRRR